MSRKRNIDDLTAAGNVIYVNRKFGVDHDSRWTNKGDRVRGPFHLLKMGCSYHESDLPVALKRESKRLSLNLSLATAFEGAHYASNGWNGTDAVVAFGSSFAHPVGGRRVVYLWRRGASRGLTLYRAGRRWHASIAVLCVCE